MRLSHKFVCFTQYSTVAQKGNHERAYMLDFITPMYFSSEKISTYNNYTFTTKLRVNTEIGLSVCLSADITLSCELLLNYLTNFDKILFTEHELSKRNKFLQCPVLMVMLQTLDSRGYCPFLIIWVNYKSVRLTNDYPVL